MTYKDVNQAALIQFQIQKTLTNFMSIEDEEERQAKTVEVLNEVNEVSFQVISGSIEYIKVPGATVFEKEFIVEFLKGCDRNAFEKIKDFGVALRESTETKPLNITCPHCQHEFEQQFDVNPVDFFG